MIDRRSVVLGLAASVVAGPGLAEARVAAVASGPLLSELRFIPTFCELPGLPQMSWIAINDREIF